MARTVTDAAILLGALEGAAPDPHDAATTACTPPPGRDYTKFLRRDALKGARIGVPRAFFHDRVTPPGATSPRGGLDAPRAAAMAEALTILKQAGAVIVDPADIPSVIDADKAQNFLAWGTCSGLDNAKGKDADCSVVLKYGMKRDFNAWLATLGPTAPVKSLTELRAFNRAHTARNAIKYNQALLDISDEMDVAADKARWEADRAKDVRLGGAHGIDQVMAEHRLDALLFPGGSGAALAAKPGYPTVIVPFALVPYAPPAPGTPAGGGGPGANAPFPAGFEPKPSPFGVAFTAGACQEPRLVALAYAFEQRTKRRLPPPAAP
jgi:amidase